MITFAALSWSVIVFIVMLTIIYWREAKGKESIKEHDLEFYSHRECGKIWLFQDKHAWVIQDLALLCSSSDSIVWLGLNYN